MLWGLEAKIDQFQYGLIELQKLHKLLHPGVILCAEFIYNILSAHGCSACVILGVPTQKLDNCYFQSIRKSLVQYLSDNKRLLQKKTAQYHFTHDTSDEIHIIIINKSIILYLNWTMSSYSYSISISQTFVRLVQSARSAHEKFTFNKHSGNNFRLRA